MEMVSMSRVLHLQAVIALGGYEISREIVFIPPALTIMPVTQHHPLSGF